MAPRSSHGRAASRYVVMSLAESYLSRAAHEADAAAEMAASRKEEKYVDRGARYIFEPIAVESLGIFNASAGHLLDDLGSRISLNSGEARETSYLYRIMELSLSRTFAPGSENDVELSLPGGKMSWIFRSLERKCHETFAVISHKCNFSLQL